MFKKIDSLSWQIFEHREIKKSNNPRTKGRVGETDWMPLPAYFGTLKHAIMKAKELNREKGLPDCSELSDAVKAIERADREFEKAIKKAVDA